MALLIFSILDEFQAKYFNNRKECYLVYDNPSSFFMGFCSLKGEESQVISFLINCSKSIHILTLACELWYKIWNIKQTYRHTWSYEVEQILYNCQQVHHINKLEVLQFICPYCWSIHRLFCMATGTMLLATIPIFHEVGSTDFMSMYCS